MGTEPLRRRDSLSGHTHIIPDHIVAGALLVVDFLKLPILYPNMGWDHSAKKHKGLWLWKSGYVHEPNTNPAHTRFRLVQNDIVIVIDAPVKKENMPEIHWGPRRCTMIEVVTPRGKGVVQWHPAFSLVSLP